MKFTIEVDDFWIEEEELSDALASHIRSSVVMQITKEIKEKVDKEITIRVKESIDQKMAVIINDKLADLFTTGIINVNSKEVSINDHVKNLFLNNRGWHSVNSQIENLAKKFSTEIKNQYDNAFANKVVLNMKAQGLLKNEVVQLLLGDE